MPTGVALRDARQQLFDAAEQVLVRDGSMGLTSRAVTEEAGCAKGVLHRHFGDFDSFLAELVLDRSRRIAKLEVGLQASAGSGSITTNLSGLLVAVFGSVALSMVNLLIARPAVRSLLREAFPVGVPILTGITTAIEDYLIAERDLGRVAATADVQVVSLTIVGAVHLLFAGATNGEPDAHEVHGVVTSCLMGARTDELGAPPPL